MTGTARRLLPASASPASATADGAVRLMPLPRQRRPRRILLAIAIMAAGIIVTVALFQRATHQISVVVATRAVPAGAVISASDIAATQVTVTGQVHVIPAAQMQQVIGQVAAAALPPGALVQTADLATSLPPAPGQVLVPVALHPSQLPVTGLAPGDRILVIATPGAQGQGGTVGNPGASPALAAPVSAVVEAVRAAPDSSGLAAVDLLVSSAEAPGVARQASTGQIALLITKRGA